MPTDFVQQLLISVQHEFRGGFLLDTSFVHTHGSNLVFSTDIDQAPLSALGCSGYNCGNPNPVFNSIIAQNYDGWSNFNALQVRLEKRMSHGVNFLVNYMWAKSLDTGTGNGHGSTIDIYQNAYSPAANYGLSNFQPGGSLTGEVVYELPFGSGRQFGLHGAADQIAGGWRVSSIFQWHSGVPFPATVQSSIAQAVDPGLDSALGVGNMTLYPQLVGNPKMSNPTNGEWFNTAAFAKPASGTFGNAGRNILVGPGFADVDFSIYKVFPLHFERMNLEIRADMFNAFNHVNYGNPDGTLGDSTFGTITGPAGGMRIIQLGAHLTF